MTRSTTIYAAPLQGYTDAAWREAHHAVYGHGIATYFAPFARVEQGAVRPRDLRDTLPSALEAPTVPQAIFRDAAELRTIVEALRAAGHRRIDLNMGCPFPPQVKHGRGAGMLGHREALAEVAEYVAATADISFSLKMRVGVDRPKQWRDVADIIKEMPLKHVTVHPRIATQQYKGGLHMDEFEALADTLPQAVIFNGDIVSPEQIADLPKGAAGAMIGRGLLARPSLAAEWNEGREWGAGERRAAIRRLHSMVLERRSARITGGESQLLSAMKPFWEYLEAEIGHKAAKAIGKSRTMAAYKAALQDMGML